LFSDPVITQETRYGLYGSYKDLYKDLIHPVGSEWPSKRNALTKLSFSLFSQPFLYFIDDYEDTDIAHEIAAMAAGRCDKAYGFPVAVI
jgi:hypothetical protein